MLVLFLALQRNCIIFSAFANYCNMAYANLWYAKIIVDAQNYFFFKFLDLFNSFRLICGNNLLYILVGISIPSLPVSNFNLHVSVFDCLLFLVLQLGMIQCCESWKLLILLLKTPLLPSMSLDCLGTLHEHLLICCHLFGVVYLGLWILSQNGLPCHIMNILGIFLACVSFHSIYSLWIPSMVEFVLSDYYSFVQTFSQHWTVCLFWLPWVLLCSLHIHLCGPG